MNGHVVDVALAGVFVLVVVNGWRRGVLGTVGSVGGLALGAVVARGFLANMPNPLAPFSPRSLATWLAVAGLCLSIGAAIGAWIGRELHNALQIGRAHV